MANCPQCNTPYDAGAMFCDNCGASLTPPAPQAAAPAPVYTPPAAPAPSYPPPVASMPAQPVQPTYPPAAPAAGASTCAQCGMTLAPGAMFCDNCGAPVSAGPAQAYPPMQQPSAYPQQPPAQQPPAYPPPIQPPVQQPPAYPQQPPTYPPQPVYGAAPRLVVQATNAPIMLPPGKAEYIVGREDPVSNVFPDVDLTPHGGDEGGVSRRHARLFQQGGQWLVEDFNSTNFTFVNAQRVQPNAPMPVPNGAELRFGRVKMMFYTQ